MSYKQPISPNIAVRGPRLSAVLYIQKTNFLANIFPVLVFLELLVIKNERKQVLPLRKAKQPTDFMGAGEERKHEGKFVVVIHYPSHFPSSPVPMNSARMLEKA